VAYFISCCLERQSSWELFSNALLMVIIIGFKSKSKDVQRKMTSLTACFSKAFNKVLVKQSLILTTGKTAQHLLFAAATQCSTSRWCTKVTAFISGTT
jgi:hypothetical protein